MSDCLIVSYLKSRDYFVLRSEKEKLSYVDIAGSEKNRIKNYLGF